MSLFFRTMRNLTILGTFFWLHGAAAQQVAKIYSVEGNVENRLGASSEWKPTVRDTSLNSGDAVRTGDGSRTAFLNAEGILIRLNANSMVEFKDNVGGVAVDQGEAHFLSRDPHQAPSVTTAIVSGSVRGTEFAVSVKPNQVVFSVLNGHVDLTNEFGRVSLVSGEEGITNRGEAPTKRIMLHPFDAVQWTLRYPAISSLDDLKEWYDNGTHEEQAGFKAISSGEYAKAEHAFSGKGERAVLGRALLAWQRRGIPDALSELNKSKGFESDQAITLFRAGLALESGQVKDAQELHAKLERSVTERNLKALLYAQEAIVALAQNRKDDAERLAENALHTNPKSVEGLFAQSALRQSRGDIEGARATIATAQELDGENPRLMARAAELAFGAGYSADAQRLAERALEKNPDDSDAHSVLGFIYLARGKVDEARAEFNKSLAGRAPPPTAHLGLGITVIRAGDKEAGRVEIEKAVHLEPTNSLFRSYLGKAFFETDRLDTAEEELNIARKLDPLDPTPDLYTAFNMLATFRPVAALDAVEDSIEKNNNRFVFRSRLLLDQDQATRAVGLGRVFAGLDFIQPVRIEALKALAEDPTNYSAHLLLKDSLIGSDTDSASTVEDVTASLLAPSTFSSILATASGAAALNEYTSLFEQTQSRTQFDVIGQSKERGFDTSAVHFAGGDDYSYLVRYATTYLNGYRDNDYQRRHTGRIVGAYDISPDDKALIEGIAIATDSGDTSLGLDPKANDSDLDITFGDVIARAGYRHTFGPGSQLLSQAAYVRSTFKLNDFDSERNFNVVSIQDEEVVDTLQDRANFDIRNRSFVSGFRGDAQHLWNTDFLSLTSGIGLVDFNETQENISLSSKDEAGLLSDFSLDSRSDTDARSYRAYSYLTLKPEPWIRVSGGSNYSAIKYNPNSQEPFVDKEDTETDFNPRAGILLYPGNHVTLRAAYFEQLGGSSARDLESLEPVQIDGIRTLFDDAVATKSRNWGTGIDWKVPKSSYLGAEFVQRRLDTPASYGSDQLAVDTLGNGTFSVKDESTELFSSERNVSTYFHQVVTRELVASMEYDWIDSDTDFNQSTARTHRNRFGLNYFHPSGFFSFGSATWRHQDRDGFGASDVDGRSDFWIVSGGIGWQIPQRHGSIQLAVRNIFDKDFMYEPTSSDSSVLPGTDLVLSASVNF